MFDDTRKQAIYDAFDNYKDFPHKGRNFLDYTPILHNVEIFRFAIQIIKEQIVKKDWKFDYIVGIETGGFIFAPVLAQELGVGFIPIRKRGKTPGDVKIVARNKCNTVDYLEIGKTNIIPGSRIVAFDDVLATGETISVIREFLKKTEFTFIGCAFFIELKYFCDRKTLNMDYVVALSLTKAPNLKDE